MIRRFDAIVIGSGAAGYGVADRLVREGVKNVAVLTEGRLSGTSRNTGSDKQTYYKLSLWGGAADSPAAMARDLAAGGGMDGDKALLQAQLSARAFYRLVELGVPFPQNAFGGFPGYRTDHDSTRRATSVGPLTSRVMTEALERRVTEENGTPVFDRRLVVKIVTDAGGVCGVLALNLDTLRLEAFSAPAVVAATGAPAAIYRDAVYPVSQRGMTGVLLSAGVKLRNFAHWQYGLASTGFRWNLSGSFLQVVPRFVSVDGAGTEREFLNDAFPDPKVRFTNIFLKGYQWPFSADRINGSSAVDLAVHNETANGRQVYLDYTKNPAGYSPELLSEEAGTYLAERGVTGNTPYERLVQLNVKAAGIYAANGIDLSKTPLPAAISAQHCNGGVQTDLYGETDVPGLYVIGEAAGNFGLTRPGGSALNETQTSGYAAAARIAEKHRPAPEPGAVEKALAEEEALLAGFTRDDTVSYAEIPALMSSCAALTRSETACRALLGKTETLLRDYPLRHVSPEAWYRDRDMLLSARALLITVCGEMPLAGSRGGALWVTENGVQPENETYHACGTVSAGDEVRFVPVKPVPADDTPFETYLNLLALTPPAGPKEK